MSQIPEMLSKQIKKYIVHPSSYITPPPSSFHIQNKYNKSKKYCIKCFEKALMYTFCEIFSLWTILILQHDLYWKQRKKILFQDFYK